MQDFVLRSCPRQDFQALTDPSDFAWATSSVFRAVALPAISGGFTGSLELVRLVMLVVSLKYGCT